MKMLAERQWEYRDLMGRVKTERSQKILGQIDELIESEKESRQKSTDRLKRMNLGDAARRAQETGVENCTAVITLLKKSRRALVNKDQEKASEYMAQAEGHREAQKKTRKKAPTAKTWNLYQQYLMEADTDFHGWLRTTGHTDELETLGADA